MLKIQTNDKNHKIKLKFYFSLKIDVRKFYSVVKFIKVMR